MADVDEPYFLTPDETLESDHASLHLRVGLPARELARRVSVCLVPVGYIEFDPTFDGLGAVRAIAVGKFPVRLLTGEPGFAAALEIWMKRWRANIVSLPILPMTLPRRRRCTDNRRLPNFNTGCCRHVR